MAPVLGYWKIRALAQPIRLMLVYAGEQFEEKNYEQGPAPDYNRESWYSVKFTLGFDFPNLPYYIDGDLKLTQSKAIAEYIAAKHNLSGSTPEERGLACMAKEEVEELRWDFFDLAYKPRKAFEQAKAQEIKAMKTKLDALSKFLGDKQWLAGTDKPLNPDFDFYDLLDTLKYLDPAIVNAHENLKNYIDRFESLPTIKAYMASDKFMKWPLNSRNAGFGGADSEP